MEGHLAEEAAVLGIVLNTSKMAIRATYAKVQGASDFVLSDVFGEGAKPIASKQLQVSRGIGTHWVGASLFWRTILHPSNALLPYGDETNVQVQCGDPELLKELRTMRNCDRSLESDPETWFPVYQGDMEQLAEAGKRSPNPTVAKPFYG